MDDQANIKPDDQPTDHTDHSEDNHFVHPAPVANYAASEPAASAPGGDGQTTQQGITEDDLSISEITQDQIKKIKEDTINYAKIYVKKGTKTRKEPPSDLANDAGPYNWWENQDSFEGSTWSASLWDYDSGAWQIQATKIDLQPDGRSRMTAYSLRGDHDTSFPGFQVYKEQSDDRYHPAGIEDLVYINRVLKSLSQNP